MLHRHFNVLLVDDEPDVLAVSKLALRRVSLYGLPVKVHTADSAAAARAFLTEHPEGRSVALALIDVVMETDTAGLDLCGWIREGLGDHVMPLVIRTGQAGKAPERAVIDAYEIAGYINKVEASEGRLYSLIKGGVRQYVMAAYDHYAGQLLYHLATHLQTPARARSAVAAGLDALTRGPGGRVQSLHASHAVLGERFYAGSGDLEDVARGRALRDHLLAQPGDELGLRGDKAVCTDQHLLLHVAGTPEHPTALQSLWSIGAPPPAFVRQTLYRATRQMQVLLSLLDR